ncbi:MAG TPA: metallopeptidase TldD-related protein [Bryobacteraceae bacterium]|nr:metallopeptidase TldD-related protein [Bryobacteraceae bacterium]
MLTREQARKLTERILSFSKFEDCSISIAETERAHIRFANNAVTTSGLAVDREITISSTRDARTGTVQVSDSDESSLKAAVAQSEHIAMISPVNQEHVEPLGPQNYAELPPPDEATANARGPVLVERVRAVIKRAAKDKLVAAGLMSRTAAVSVIANKAGNFGYRTSADAALSTTIRRPDGASSGWASKPSSRIADIRGGEVGDRASEKCLRWMKPVRLEPGRYEVVLEPTAVSDLLDRFGLFQMQARAAEEGRSPFARTGGGSVLGEKMFPELVTLRSDPFDARYPGMLWSAAGIPNRRVTWIDKGVVRELWYDRYWGKKNGREPTPTPAFLFLEGGNANVDNLIAATKRGLLVTRFWYIRPVNPRTGQQTGLTRDGLFLIENGKVTQPVVNMRFNESAFRLLQNVKQLGRPVRCRGGEGSGMIAPAMRASDFNFTSISDAI